MSNVSESKTEKSWYNRVLGRSVLSIVFGNFLEKKNNASSIIAILLVIAACYITFLNVENRYAQYLFNALFVVIGYYFGAKQMTVSDDEN